ncbi:FecCD family ABC transporter permease [Rhizobium paknamense]|uniref:Iron complex transport system permease protein n=1 Tax=Rhizobium paknamense TaxID=1206817 RepID=A0ABU0IEM7_9HYPH|nr:iron ABC transporter permease [Rhizobium paknamense]MDQ0456693.1 iron complex transport system permease protein [Rhizobium paknamense]
MSMALPSPAAPLQEACRRTSRRQGMMLGGMALLLLALMIGDLATGPSALPLQTLITALFAGPDGDDRMNAIILWQLRMPQTLLGAIVGGCLGLAGLKMQTILDNPLASPFTLGFSAAAGFGAALAILLGGLIAVPLYLLTPLAAFVMTLIACAMVYAVAMMRGAGPAILVLAGTAVMFFFQSLQALMQFLASPEVLQQIVFWLFGSLLKATWQGVAIAGGILAVALPWALCHAWQLTMLRLGEANAASLGLKVERLRRQSFIMVALLTAAAVSFVGTIGFIGLIAPHLARALVGEDHRLSLPLSALSGAVLLIAASLIGKVISPGGALPVGIVTAIAGVPVLFGLVLHQGRERVR